MISLVPLVCWQDHAFIPGITSSHYEYLVASAPAEDRAAASGSPAQPARAQVRRRFNDFVVSAALNDASLPRRYVCRPEGGRRCALLCRPPQGGGGCTKYFF
jgi:hypothetical protein